MSLVIAAVVVIAIVIGCAWLLDLRKEHRGIEDASEDRHRYKQRERDGAVFRKHVGDGR